jgi:hypothetical protein
MKATIISTLFLIVTLGSLAYVAAKLDQFNTQLSKELVSSISGVNR